MFYKYKNVLFIFVFIFIILLSMLFAGEVRILENYNFETGLAEMHENGLTKYTDIFGITKFSSKDFNFVIDNGDGTIMVASDEGKFGLIDTSGNYIVEPKYEWFCSDVSEGLRLVESKEDCYGFIDNSGNTVIEAKYSRAESFSEGLALVMVDGKYGYINKKDEMVIQPKYDKANSFSEGVAFVKDGDEYYYINHDGKKAFDYNYYMPEFYGFFDICRYSEGLAPVIKEGKVGFIDKYGKIVIDFTFDSGNIPHEGDETYKFIDGIAIVKKDSKYAAINNKGETIIDLSVYNKVKGFSDGLALVQKEVIGNWGYIDTKGNEVIEPKYGYAESFKNGSATVMVNNAKIKVYKNGRSMEDTSNFIIAIISVVYAFGIIIIIMLFFVLTRPKENK